ncbi:hypothetical protein NE237_023109 [Protea cynaroides]|uniref:Uncharacterized protein n=1 Tax=Protea cynaroides TaxID=273540 RepID=A0A9Q0K5W1_9MAGN|nr:hypothetical protein NE237_028531 [Protea cynaroides]KAJ4963170.1 hypothetical protein NE237_023109 [Protea cynaroides]
MRALICSKDKAPRSDKIGETSNPQKNMTEGQSSRHEGIRQSEDDQVALLIGRRDLQQTLSQLNEESQILGFVFLALYSIGISRPMWKYHDIVSLRGVGGRIHSYKIPLTGRSQILIDIEFPKQSSRRPTHPVCVGAQFISPFGNFPAKELLCSCQITSFTAPSFPTGLDLSSIRIVDPCCEMVRNDQKVRAENLIRIDYSSGPFLLSDRRRTNGEEVVDKVR